MALTDTVFSNLQAEKNDDTGLTTRNGTDARQAKIAAANRFQTIITKVQIGEFTNSYQSKVQTIFALNVTERTKP